MSVSIKVAKAAFRKKMRAVLKTIPADITEQQSKAVTARLLATEEYQRSSKVALFLSMKGEVGTNDILWDIFQSGKQCFVPMCNPDVMEMVLLKSWADFESLPRNSWGIPEPQPQDGRLNALDPTMGGLDLIIMPGLAFDHSGNRIGYGKGYYDVFLKKCHLLAAERGNQPPTTIAVCLREQYVPSVPIEPHDLKPDRILMAL
ncbi:hypothetical protein BASA50_005282 [Batrachochytrium salamandrivorans]|uniref:5-formyltetrahydrofolate cyclo-ligase n=1 Tax=Batrachochytrium salamandrivorans TaxID=1357716 RepID=A0ABQ8FD80_9FUNG|nr:hypothetical protein BASA60_009648 [Batrachochytrium salamandrivorans]KAH6589831.1 hypothetical protein BASA61_005474 [Batrachochytrium salamandrivorans]KAH6596241.1 hypothetical protein BASA50_005282 [Batrachochytrium salamandrivorans]